MQDISPFPLLLHTCKLLNELEGFLDKGGCSIANALLFFLGLVYLSPHNAYLNLWMLI